MSNRSPTHRSLPAAMARAAACLMVCGVGCAVALGWTSAQAQPTVAEPAVRELVLVRPADAYWAREHVDPYEHRTVELIHPLLPGVRFLNTLSLGGTLLDKAPEALVQFWERSTTNGQDVYSLLCTGTVVPAGHSNNKVLTAGHCAEAIEKAGKFSVGSAATPTSKLVECKGNSAGGSVTGSDVAVCSSKAIDVNWPHATLAASPLADHATVTGMFVSSATSCAPLQLGEKLTFQSLTLTLARAGELLTVKDVQPAGALTCGGDSGAGAYLGNALATMHLGLRNGATVHLDVTSKAVKDLLALP